jgi:hypothetical protein
MILTAQKIKVYLRKSAVPVDSCLSESDRAFPPIVFKNQEHLGQGTKVSSKSVDCEGLEQAWLVQNKGAQNADKPKRHSN